MVAEMESELHRLRSFINWPPVISASSSSASRLSRCGFYYTGPGDCVTCWPCQVEFHGWATVDELVSQHQQTSPHCQQQTSDSTPAANNPKHTHHCHQMSTTTCLPLNHSNQPVLNHELTTATCSRPTEPIVDTSCTNTAETVTTQRVRHKKPKHPQWSNVSERVKSFETGRVGLGQTVHGLAAAGFFYVGPEDNVRCFYCDGGLKNWQPTDDPWTQHVRWFPRCPFVRHSRDQTTGQALSQIVNGDVSVVSTATRSVTCNVNTELQTTQTSAACDTNCADSLNALEETNRQLREARTCKVCMDKEVDTVFLPCGHLVCCSNCSPELRNCAVCRALIRGTVKIFLG